MKDASTMRAALGVIITMSTFVTAATASLAGIARPTTITT